MSIIESYFYYIKKYNRGDLFMERLKEVIKNPIIISDPNNFKTYNQKKIIRKQFVVCLILRYFELYGKQVIPSFYELWNICFPDEIQQKKKLSKYDTMHTRNQKKYKLKQNMNSNVDSQKQFYSNNNYMYQNNNNQDLQSIQTCQKNSNFDQYQRMANQNNKSNWNYTNYPYSQFSQPNQLEQENHYSQTSQYNNYYQPQAKFEENSQQISCQLPYSSYNRQQFVQKYDFPFSQNFQQQNQPYYKLESNKQNSQINNISLSYHGYQNAQNIQPINASQQPQCGFQSSQVKSEETNQFDSIFLPPISTNEQYNQKMENTENKNNLNEQPQPKLEENSLNNFSSIITNSSNISSQNIKIQETQSAQTSCLPQNDFNLSQVKLEDNQQTNQITNYYFSANNLITEKKEEIQFSQKDSEIQFNSLHSHIKSKDIDQNNSKIHQGSALESQIIILNQGNELNSELENNSVLSEIKNEESYQTNNSVISSISLLTSQESIEFQESPNAQNISNQIETPIDQEENEEIKQKTNKIKLNLSIKSIQNTTYQQITQDSNKIYMPEFTQSIQNQNQILSPIIKSDENIKIEDKLNLNLSLNNQNNVQNLQSQKMQNEPNFQLNQVKKEEENKNYNINPNFNISHNNQQNAENPQICQIKDNLEQPQIKIEQINEYKFKINICKNSESQSIIKKEEEPLTQQVQSNSDQFHKNLQQNKPYYQNVNNYRFFESNQNAINQQYLFSQNIQANKNFQQPIVMIEEKNYTSNSNGLNFLSLNRQQNLQNKYISSFQQYNQVFNNNPQSQVKFEENPQLNSNQNLNSQKLEEVNTLVVKEEQDNQKPINHDDLLNPQKLDCKKEEPLNLQIGDLKHIQQIN
ncbi:hypothetical protein ABPG74_019150 [Tetrahymena malaccensis]